MNFKSVSNVPEKCFVKHVGRKMMCQYSREVL